MFKTLTSNPIISPRSDLLFIAFGWLIFPLIYFSIVPFWDDGQVFKVLLLTTLAINFMHRNITILFAYGDFDEFKHRKTRYILLPIFFALLTAGILYFSPGNFKFLATLSVIWTIYHVVMQKVGLLRIYTKKKDAKSGAGLDKMFIWFSFLTLVLTIASLDGTYTLLMRQGHTARLVVNAFQPARGWMPFLGGASVFAYLAFLFYYVRNSIQSNLWSRERLMFIVSYLSVLGFFYLDFLAAYAFFSLSHSLEYLALSKHIGTKKGTYQTNQKSPIAIFSRNPTVWFILYVIVTGGLLLVWRDLSNQTLFKFIVGSSFLHFLYDGWLWKLRKPKVAVDLDLKKAV